MCHMLIVGHISFQVLIIRCVTLVQITKVSYHNVATHFDAPALLTHTNIQS